jgi:hypothetical protein
MFIYIYRVGARPQRDFNAFFVVMRYETVERSYWDLRETTQRYIILLYIYKCVYTEKMYYNIRCIGVHTHTHIRNRF